MTAPQAEPKPPQRIAAAFSLLACGWGDVGKEANRPY
jgi:hypothetical protein